MEVIFKKRYIYFISFFFIYNFSSCEDLQALKPINAMNDSVLPEKLIAVNGPVSAHYILPTQRYGHAILGDDIEAGGLLVSVNGRQYRNILSDEFVFEDLQPRIVNVDEDGEMEFVCIQTNINFGASVAIYKIVDDSLRLHWSSGYIGTRNRWLNIVAIQDLNNDGKVEIAWVQTPHIGGILKIANIENGIFKLWDEKKGVSNHQIGSRNLCLSVVKPVNNCNRIYLPSQSYLSVIGAEFQSNKIVFTDTIQLKVDSNIPLLNQYNWGSILTDVSCINSEQ